MSSRQLPLIKAPITGLQCLTYPLSILLNYDECYPWFYSNYIQLDSSNEGGNGCLSFPMPWMTDLPWITFIDTRKGIFTEMVDDMAMGLARLIDDGYYIYSWFDEYFVPHRTSYQKKNFIHDFLLTGYDTEKQEFSLYGYNEKMLPEQTKISFSLFRQSFQTEWDNFILFMKKRDNYFFEFDCRLVFDMLCDYYYSRNSSEDSRMYSCPPTDRFFGMDIYKFLEDYFVKLVESYDLLDFRNLRNLWEHKKCMNARILYMRNRNILKDVEKLDEMTLDLANKVMKLRDLEMKYSFTKNGKIIEKIIYSLREITCLEKLAIEALLEKMASVCNNL